MVTVKANVGYNPADYHDNRRENVDEVELSDLALVILEFDQSPLVKRGPVDWNNHKVEDHREGKQEMTQRELEMLLACMLISSKFECKNQMACHGEHWPITCKDKYSRKWKARKADKTYQHHD